MEKAVDRGLVFDTIGVECVNWLGCFGLLGWDVPIPGVQIQETGGRV